MQSDELELVEKLTGARKDEIKFSDDGFLSRGYVVDDGKIVFKFRKSPEVSYQNEIEVLDFVNSLDLDINLQEVGWKPEDDAYLGLYGVQGKALEEMDLDDAVQELIGKQLGRFLKKLHAAEKKDAEACTLEAEIEAWQKRYQRDAKEALAKYFSTEELARIDNLMMVELPAELRRLGEKLVFSHGDLGDGNIFIDDSGEVGVIDFNGSCYLDEAADFMDVQEERICKAMLEEYGADETLRRKVAIRRAIRPIFVIGTYAKADRKTELEGFARQIRTTLERIYVQGCYLFS